MKRMRYVSAMPFKRGYQAEPFLVQGITPPRDFKSPSPDHPRDYTLDLSYIQIGKFLQFEKTSPGTLRTISTYCRLLRVEVEAPRRCCLRHVIE